MNKQKGSRLKITWKWMKRKIRVLLSKPKMKGTSELEISHCNELPNLFKLVVKKRSTGTPWVYVYNNINVTYQTLIDHH